MLTDSEIKLFQDLHKKHFGEDISQKEALVLGVKLVNLLQIVNQHYIKIKIKENARKLAKEMQ